MQSPLSRNEPSLLACLPAEAKRELYSDDTAGGKSGRGGKSAENLCGTREDAERERSPAVLAPCRYYNSPAPFLEEQGLVRCPPRRNKLRQNEWSSPVAVASMRGQARGPLQYVQRMQVRNKDDSPAFAVQVHEGLVSTLSSFVEHIFLLRY